MFTPQELEALVLGSLGVAGRDDDHLRDAARSALARIAAVLPPDLRNELDASALLVGPGVAPREAAVDTALLRQAIRTEHRLSLCYQDRTGASSKRVVWSFALAFFDRARVLLGCCELRQEFRSFCTDRITRAEVLDEHYPRRRKALLKAWGAIEKIPEQNTAAIF